MTTNKFSWRNENCLQHANIFENINLNLQRMEFMILEKRVLVLLKTNEENHYNMLQA
jgi:hypothetical protein